MTTRLVPDETIQVGGYRFEVARQDVRVADRSIGAAGVLPEVTKPAVGVETQVDEPRWWAFDAAGPADTAFQRIVERLRAMKAADDTGRDYKVYQDVDRAVEDARAAGADDMELAFVRQWAGTARDPNAGPSASFVWNQLDPALPSGRPSVAELRDRLESRRATQEEEARVERQFTDQQLREMSMERLFGLISTANTPTDRARAQTIYEERRSGGEEPATGGEETSQPGGPGGMDPGGGSTVVAVTGGPTMAEDDVPVFQSDEDSGEAGSFDFDRLVGALTSGDMDLVMSELRQVPPIWWVALIGAAALVWATVTGRDFGSLGW